MAMIPFFSNIVKVTFTKAQTISSINSAILGLRVSSDGFIDNPPKT
jgi:hypothetical protein